MRLKQNSSTAIVVKQSWANLQAIQVFLRDRPQNGNGKSASHARGNGHSSQPAQSGDDGCTIIARVLDDTDVRGLWIELNTHEHEKDSAIELQALMIPWPAVLAIVVGNHFASATKEAEEQESVDYR
jgi:hypothetical protein